MENQTYTTLVCHHTIFVSPPSQNLQSALHDKVLCFFTFGLVWCDICVTQLARGWVMGWRVWWGEGGGNRTRSACGTIISALEFWKRNKCKQRLDKILLLANQGHFKGILLSWGPIGGSSLAKILEYGLSRKKIQRDSTDELKTKTINFTTILLISHCHKDNLRIAQVCAEPDICVHNKHHQIQGIA